MNEETENAAVDEPGDEWAEEMSEQTGVDTAVADDDVAVNGEDQPVAEFENLVDTSEGPGSIENNMDVILDIPVTISMEIGRTSISIRNLLQLNQGSVVELDRLAGEPMDVLVNGTLVAHGEVVVVNEKFGIRLTDVISPAERVKRLR